MYVKPGRCITFRIYNQKTEEVRPSFPLTVNVRSTPPQKGGVSSVN
jgi:hypothetical protein